MKDNIYRVAELDMKIQFAESTTNNKQLIESFEPFRVSALKGSILFHLTIDDNTQPYPKEKRERIRNFDTGSGHTIVDKLDDGGYQFIIRDIYDADCALVITNADFCERRCALNGNMNMRRFGLNNTLMLIYAFASCPYDTLMLHASLVRQNGYGYAFIAKSGTGKSTHVSLWLRHLKGCDLMNDDNPILRIIGGKVYIFGSPWSGKTPCYRNVKAPLGARRKLHRQAFACGSLRITSTRLLHHEMGQGTLRPHLRYHHQSDRIHRHLYPPLPAKQGGSPGLQQGHQREGKSG